MSQPIVVQQPIEDSISLTKEEKIAKGRRAKSRRLRRRLLSSPVKPNPTSQSIVVQQPVEDATSLIKEEKLAKRRGAKTRRHRRARRKRKLAIAASKQINGNQAQVNGFDTFTMLIRAVSSDIERFKEQQGPLEEVNRIISSLENLRASLSVGRARQTDE